MSDYFSRKSKEWDQHKYRIERAQQVASSILRKVPVNERTRVLDFGCGTGLLGFDLIEQVGHVTFGDTSQGMLDQVTKKIDERMEPKASVMLLVEGQTLPESDLTVSLMVLHHIEDVESTLSGLASAIVTGGHICLCDLDKEDGSFHQEEVVPHNGFERSFIESTLVKNGFEILDTSTVFVNQKEIGGSIMDFPVFMVVGRKTA